jgi:O-antigen ligase
VVADVARQGSTERFPAAASRFSWADSWMPPGASWFPRGAAAIPVLVLLAAVAGAAVVWSPPAAAAVAIGAVFAVRFGLTTAMLHGLVLSIFAESVTVGGYRLGRVLAVVVALYLVLRLLSGWRPAAIPALAWVPPLLFLTWNWASGFWATSAGGWQSDIGGLALAAGYFLAFALLVSSPEQLRQLLRTYVLGAAVVSFYSVLQATEHVRAVGLQGDPNIFALYQVAAIPAAGMLARTTHGTWRRVGWLLVLVPLVASVVAAQSRGGLATVALLLPIALIRGDFGRLPRAHAVISGLTAAGVLAAVGVVATRFADRLSIASVLQDGGTGRLDIWHVALHAYREHPVLGLGAGGFQPMSGQLLATTPGVHIEPFSSYFLTGIRVHDIYLEALTELGPIGLLLWLAILGCTVAVLVRSVGARVRATPASALLLMLGVFAVATVFLSINNNKMLWMVVGLAAAAGSSAYASGRGSDWARGATGLLPGDTGIGGARRDTTRGSFAYSSPPASLRRTPSRDEAPGPVGN